MESSSCGSSTYSSPPSSCSRWQCAETLSPHFSERRSVDSQDDQPGSPRQAYVGRARKKLCMPAQVQPPSSSPARSPGLPVLDLQVLYGRGGQGAPTRKRVRINSMANTLLVYLDPLLQGRDGEKPEAEADAEPRGGAPKLALPLEVLRRDKAQERRNLLVYNKPVPLHPPPPDRGIGSMGSSFETILRRNSGDLPLSARTPRSSGGSSSGGGTARGHGDPLR